MNSEKIKKIILSIGRTDINKILDYQKLIFNFYYKLVKDSNQFNEDELSAIRKAFKYCSDSDVKIESINRQRRVLTGITKGVKGELFNEANYIKSLEKEKEMLTDLGY